MACEYCNQPLGIGKRFCSKECYRLFRVGKPIPHSYTFPKGHEPWNKGTHGLMLDVWTGRKHSPEVRRKLSLYAKTGVIGIKGKKHNEETKAKMREKALGRKHTEASRRLISLHNKTPRGKDNPHWKGGTGTERHRLMNQKEYILWRTAVFVRDDYTCQSCNIRGGELNADHIKPWSLYPELRYAIDNGRTLCIDCHRQTDTWGYRVNSVERIG